ncbi:MAG: HAD-IIB family hydrolase [Bacillota bacterium]|uniref:HAD-IIB family hydrolase n=1 Tax=Virgibacillus TaxID=84406 RepID=UPI000EF4C5ED|nr:MULTISPECIES: HAD-IIB family hydrolase [Virgibacillus]WBX78803.1 HAD-IIB family hydrolase [Virgibacillus salarius]
MIFVFDLDGTICFNGESLSYEMREALDVCIQHGHEIIFASARPIRDLLPVLPKRYRHFRMVGGNGAFTFENGKMHVRTFTPNLVLKIKRLIEKYHLTYLVDSDWDYSYTGEVQHSIFRNLDPEKQAENKSLDELKMITKIVLFTTTDEIKHNLSHLPVQIYEHGRENLLDISPLGIHKMNGLNQLGIQSGEFIAFGNDQNDLELFRNATYSVCVGEHAMKEYATISIKKENVPATIKNISDYAKHYNEALKT